MHRFVFSRPLVAGTDDEKARERMMGAREKER